MADVVNLRTARKRAKRSKDDQLARANRLVHGRPKGAQDLETARQEKAADDLERHRIERGDGR
jgi:hypothetical protein